MLKVKNDPSPGIDTDIFLQQAQTQYNLRYHNDLKLLQYDLCIKDPKVFHFLDLRYGIIFPQT